MSQPFNEESLGTDFGEPNVKPHITFEELSSLLAIIPTHTRFIIGPPPENAENTLSLQIHCQLPPGNAEKVQALVRSFACYANTETNPTT